MPIPPPLLPRLQVFRYLQSLRVITDVLLSSMGAFLAIASLMTLFIFVFAIVGLQASIWGGSCMHAGGGHCVPKHGAVW